MKLSVVSYQPSADECQATTVVLGRVKGQLERVFRRRCHKRSPYRDGKEGKRYLGPEGTQYY